MQTPSRALVRSLSAASSLAALLALGLPLSAAQPTVSQALRLEPVQTGIEYDQPTTEEIPKCRVEPLKKNGIAGWSVYNGSNQLLRKFIDRNRDNRIDQWSYFRNGIEVYRDIDDDHNGKAEQYRWLGTAGARWGLDADEDGQVDRWKSISPEEVTAEVVAALKTGDAERFQRVLLTPQELTGLELAGDQASDLTKRIEQARTGFGEFAKSQKMVGKEAEWVQFGATRPGIVPAGTAGSRKDLVLYDHAAAIVETSGRHGQVIIGTLVKVGDGWRVIDLPREKAATGLFFTAITGQAESQQIAENVGLDREQQALLKQLEEVDKRLETATPGSEMGKLNGERAGVLQQLVNQAQTPADKETWVRQFADTVSAAVQTGEYAAGVERLQNMLRQLETDKADAELIGYVKFRFLTADYGQNIQQPNADFAKIQEKWLADLAKFVRAYPKQEDAAEAMLQLAIAEEFAGNEKQALRWFQQIVRDFPGSPRARKAQGAETRLRSVGRRISLQGKSLQSGNLDLERYQGKVVLLHYWATWCEPCKEDLQKIKALQAKYGGRFAPVGVNVDHNRDAAVGYVKSQRISWPQMHEEGGLDSRLANQLGVLTLPTMLLIDPSGKVVRRNVHVAELDAEIKKILN